MGQQSNMFCAGEELINPSGVAFQKNLFYEGLQSFMGKDS